MELITKTPYNKLKEEDKKNVIKFYYERKNLNFKELSYELNISERALSRVLKEANINTKRINRYRLNEDYFHIIDTEEKSYILGLLFADGYVGNEKFNNIVLALNDLELLEKIAKAFEYDGVIRKGKKGGFENSKENYILSFSSERMANDLRNLGLYPNKSLTISVLPELKESLFSHFVRGYFDGDGSVFLSKHTSYHNVGGKTKKYEYPSYCFTLLGTEEFLNKMVSKMQADRYHILNTKTESIKEIRINAKCELNWLFNYLYGDSTIFLERKFNKWLEIMSAFMK